MGIVKKNLVTTGLSGKIGGMLVFRKVGNQTIVATAPAKSERPPSADQLTRQERFKKAAAYAKAQLADPLLKAAYEALAKGREMASAYNMAVGDFFNAPVITEIDLAGYTGAANDPVRVRATDDFRVDSVFVEIMDGNGSLLESGPALQQANGFDWIYKATKTNTALTGSKVVIKATDLPGNETRAEQTL